MLKLGIKRSIFEYVFFGTTSMSPGWSIGSSERLCDFCIFFTLISFASVH